jgi:hypothetical protein
LPPFAAFALFFATQDLFGLSKIRLCLGKFFLGMLHALLNSGGSGEFLGPQICGLIDAALFGHSRRQLLAKAAIASSRVAA